MIDIHTHLYWESYDMDRDDVIARAQEAGVETMFVVGCSLKESEKCIDLSEQYPRIFASVGIHPNEMRKEIEGTTMQALGDALEKMASQKKVVAIGECGLDYYTREEMKDEEGKHLQREGFLMQIALAEKLQKPLIVHCRPSLGTMDAYEDILSILSSLKHTVPIILHCYMGDTEITEKFLEISGLYFSFTANITYPVKKEKQGTKDDLTETVKRIPLERILIETDCPFLAPQEKRGKRNEPVYVLSVLEKIAMLRGVESSTLKTIILNTVQKVFSV